MPTAREEPQGTLGPVSLTAMGIGAVIGAGIFVLTGTAAARYAGPAVVLSFSAAGVVCALVGLCYAELAATLPVSGGSAYSYTRAALGPFMGWLIGWDLVLEYAAGAATVAVGWSSYVASLLDDAGWPVPSWAAASPWEGGLANLPAAGIVAVLTILLIAGTRESSVVNNVMVAVKLVVVVVFVALGARHVDPAHWHPFVPPNAGHFGQFGPSGVLRGASVGFFAFLGFDTVATAAGDAARPQRDVPLGLLLSLAVCTVLYVLLAGVLTGLVPYAELNVAAPIAKGVDAVGMPWLGAAVKLGALCGLTTVVLVLLFAQARVFSAVAADGLLPPVFARVDKRRGTPAASQALIGAVVAAVAAFVPLSVLGEMVSIGTLAAFALVCASVLRLRRTDPGRPRPFRAPLVPALPLLAIALCLVLMAGLPGATWLRLAAWSLIGLGVYAAYGRRHQARPERQR